jgi:tRNA(Ile)-lysidine synthetase-like protein
LRRLVVAVSGGADSLCLLDALVAVAVRPERSVIVGHVDHQLRPDAAADADFVRAVAADSGLRCEVLTVDVPALAASERLGVEEAARLGRYRALRALAGAVGAGAVVTGHTRDDSVETVLLHLLRGTGPRGLGGLADDETLRLPVRGGEVEPRPRPALRVVRPLVGVDRSETHAYCTALGIQWRVDPTNADPRLLRNRVRGHLLPVLRTYNPAVDRAIVRLATAAHDEERWLDGLAERALRRLGRAAGGRRAIDLEGWRRQPVALRRRVIRRIAALAGYDEIGFDAVERAIAVGDVDGPPRAELGGGLIVERGPETLVFEVLGRGSDDRAGTGLASGS